MANLVKGSAKWAKILLFGDSLTQRSFSPDGCWGSLLADFVMRRCDLVVRGFSGYNSRFCKLILPDVLNADDAKDIVAVTIFLGANDSGSLEKGGKQHVPLAEYGRNLKEMVEYCVSLGLKQEQIILITPPAFYQEAWDAHCVETGKSHEVGARTNKVTETYAAMCCKVAREQGTASVDLYSEMMKHQDLKSYLNDGLHLSEKGSVLLFQLLKPIVSDLTSHIPAMLYPYWADIDNRDEESARQSLRESGWLE